MHARDQVGCGLWVVCCWLLVVGCGCQEVAWGAHPVRCAWGPRYVPGWALPAAGPWWDVVYPRDRRDEQV